jgi:hypothetical protein
MPAAISACGTVIAAVAAVFAASAIGGGGDDDEAAPPSGTIVITASPLPTESPLITDPPTPSPPPGARILAGSWDFRYTVLSNNCGFGSPVGSRIDYTLQINERYPDDGFIDEGDDAEIFDQGFRLGFIELTYPNFGFQYPINAFGYAGTADVQITFEDSESGHGTRVDTYDDGAGSTCSIAAEDS